MVQYLHDRRPNPNLRSYYKYWDFKHFTIKIYFVFDFAAIGNYKLVTITGARFYQTYTSWQLSAEMFPTWPTKLFDTIPTATAEMMGLFFNLQTKVLLVCGGQQVKILTYLIQSNFVWPPN